MPGFNKQGPNNEGPRTGRSMGQCGRRTAENSTKSEVSDEQKGGITDGLWPLFGRRRQGGQGGQRGQGGQSNGRGFGRGKGRC
ncbi:DUF5320 domain-containing protein [Mangrovibacterium sp.]|uniref:DUF5320 domain-containing protein n=1 Tax=Mangrovibacterium sp. TaxID=1961364 RepID=UPI0035633621